MQTKKMSTPGSWQDKLKNILAVVFVLIMACLVSVLGLMIWTMAFPPKFEIAYHMTGAFPCEKNQANPTDSKAIFLYEIKVGNTGTQPQFNVKVKIYNLDTLINSKMMIVKIKSDGSYTNQNMARKYPFDDQLILDIPEFQPNTAIILNVGCQKDCSHPKHPQIKIDAKGVKYGDPFVPAFIRKIQNALTFFSVAK